MFIKPLADNYRHVCSSFARVQLFRLKGAQRKLKTDRNKIERLTPIDLRKRYQISTRLTTFYNTSSFDPLYSLPPLLSAHIQSRHTTTMITTQQQTVTPSSSSSVTPVNHHNSVSSSAPIPHAASPLLTNNDFLSTTNNYYPQSYNNSDFKLNSTPGPTESSIYSSSSSSSSVSNNSPCSTTNGATYSVMMTHAANSTFGSSLVPSSTATIYSDYPLVSANTSSSSSLSSAHFNCEPDHFYAGQYDTYPNFG